MINPPISGLDFFIISIEYDGKKRKLFPKDCEMCPRVVMRPSHKLVNTRFCSIECSDKAKSFALLERECPFCHKKFTAKQKRLSGSKSGILFCSRPCKDGAQEIGGVFEQKHADTGKYSYRKKALKHLKPVCGQCGYRRFVRMLDVDHVDGNRNNGAICNLQILYVWCHALKTRCVPIHKGS